MYKAKDHTGEKYGNLTVLRKDCKTKCRQIKWLCKCDCGNTRSVLWSNLKSGAINSCGCLNKKRKCKHGLSRSDEYTIYYGMLKRCYDKTERYYKNYGGRGVTVCDRWNPEKGGSFENFYADMGPRPGKNYSLDKEAVDKKNKIYCPEMCKWATKQEQAQRRRNNTYVEYGGEILLIEDLEKKLGMNKGTLRSRIDNGWPKEKWADPPQPNISRTFVAYKNENILVDDLAKRLNLKKKTLLYRIKKGWPEERWDEPASYSRKQA